MKLEKLLNKLPLNRFPFWFKLFWAKCFIRMLNGFGDTYVNDLILYRELELWIKTDGRPTTSNPDYQINVNA